jgi:hypothetical protein
MYRWIAQFFPPDDDSPAQGVHFVGPEEQVRMWRDSVLAVVTNRSTIEGVMVLADLTRDFPDCLSIVASLVNARTAYQAEAWVPPSPEELARLLNDTTRRLVRSNRELLEMLVDVIASVQLNLPSHGELLWNWNRSSVSRKTSTDGAAKSDRAGSWRPKYEAALSAYVAHELELRLSGRGVAVNREVLVQPTDSYGAGERTDILVEARLTSERPGSRPMISETRVAVVVEVKGAWNADLRSAQDTQLASRYLPEVNTNAGIYLIGWFPIDQWNGSQDSRRAVAARIDRDALETALNEQAAEIQMKTGRLTVPMFLDIPRPHTLIEQAAT